MSVDGDRFLAHRTGDIPVWRASTLTWATACWCGWGATGDSPEATVIALAHHLEEFTAPPAGDRTHSTNCQEA